MAKYMSETYFSADYEQAPKAAAGISMSALAAAIRRLFAALGQWNERAAQRRRLLELDDRMLADIAVNPIDAWNEGSKPFWQD